MGNTSVFELAMTKPISEMNPPYLKTLISISNSLLFTLVLTMYFLDTVELYIRTGHVTTDGRIGKQRSANLVIYSEYTFLKN